MENESNGDSLELIAGTRNSYVHLYEEPEYDRFILDIGGTEYVVDREFADRFESDRGTVDAETIEAYQERGDW